MKHNNVWVDDQGGVKATKRILVGQELLLSYEGKRRSYVDRKPKARATVKAKATGTITTVETIGVANVARRRGTVDLGVAQQNLGEHKFKEGPRKKKK
jgi:exo-beta-1,3-glucanase (GH17 family)